MLPESLAVRYRFVVRNAWFGEERVTERLNHPWLIHVDVGLLQERGVRRTLHRFGYLPVRRLWHRDATEYSRWQIWPLLKVKALSIEMVYSPLRQLHRLGIIHLSSHEGQPFRFRDLRFGPDR